MYQSTEITYIGVSTLNILNMRWGQSLGRAYLHYTFSLDVTPPDTLHKVKRTWQDQTIQTERWPTSRVKIAGAPMVPQKGGTNVSLPKGTEVLILEYTKGTPPFVRVRVINTGMVGFIQPGFIEST